MMISGTRTVRVLSKGVALALQAQRLVQLFIPDRWVVDNLLLSISDDLSVFERVIGYKRR